MPHILDLIKQFEPVKGKSYTIVEDYTHTNSPIPTTYGDVLVGVYYDGLEAKDTVSVFFADYEPDFFYRNVHYPTIQLQFELTNSGIFMPLYNTAALELYKMPHQPVSICSMEQSKTTFYYIFQSRKDYNNATHPSFKYNNGFLIQQRLSHTTTAFS